MSQVTIMPLRGKEITETTKRCDFSPGLMNRLSIEWLVGVDWPWLADFRYSHECVFFWWNPVMNSFTEFWASKIISCLTRLFARLVYNGHNHISQFTSAVEPRGRTKIWLNFGRLFFLRLLGYKKSVLNWEKICKFQVSFREILHFINGGSQDCADL